MWLVFGQALGFSFINFDDEVYVYANPVVSQGLSPSGLVWAFTHAHARNWHPFTTITHMLDCQLFGLWAGGHHFGNILLHSVSAATLFVALRKMTGAFWRSAFVAALFALHPLRVESVVWVAERKDVLSGLFFMLTLYAYAQYVHEPKGPRRFAVVALCFAAGLLCKPMLVTLPVVLLLLDYWPFRNATSVSEPKRAGAPPRILARGWRACVGEKWLLYVLSALSSVATLLAQSGSTGATVSFPVSWRLQNAVVSVAIYLGQLVWPVNLAPFYPHPAGSLALSNVLCAVSLLLAVSGLAIYYRRQAPWLLTGWLWYLIMLLPVIGVVQAGMQARADRYTYLPQIGLYVAASWSLASVVKRWRIPRPALVVAATVILLTMSWVTFVQTKFWRNSRSLWIHTAAVTRENEVAENNLGILLEHDGNLDEAVSHYEKAVAIQTSRGKAYYSLTLALSETNLGRAFAAKGEIENAISHCRAAVELRPDYADGWFNLGVVLLRDREAKSAAQCLTKALAIRPEDAVACGYLGDALWQTHDDAAALKAYEKAIALQPRALWAIHSLAWLLATSPEASVRNGERATTLARQGLELFGESSAELFRALAAGYAADGNFNSAREAAERGREVARVTGDENSARALEGDLQLYRENIPVREITP